MALFTSMFANKALSVRAEGQPTHDAHLEGEKTIQKAVNRCVTCFLACTLQDAPSAARVLSTQDQHGLAAGAWWTMQGRM